jgi:hypothetical protein
VVSTNSRDLLVGLRVGRALAEHDHGRFALASRSIAESTISVSGS